MEQRLKRIHDRQEAARKLAHNVELLLQQKSLIGHGGGINQNTPRMTSSELMTTACHVAKDFRTLTCQMTKDFSVDDKNNNLSKECQRQVMPTHQKEKPTSLVKSSSNDNNRSVAFTVGFDEDKQPVSPIPKALQVPCRKDKSKLTAQELDEKLRKAAERRNVSQVTMLLTSIIIIMLQCKTMIKFTYIPYFNECFKVPITHRCASILIRTKNEKDARFGKGCPWNTGKKSQLVPNWVWHVLTKCLCDHCGMSFKLPFCHLLGHVYTKEFI